MNKTSLSDTTVSANQNRGLKISNGKYAIIGSEAQVAATESKSNLNLCRRVFRAAKFSNGCKALVVMQVATKREAQSYLNRSNTALAFVSGRLGRWLTPTFVIVKTATLNAR